MCTGRMHLRGFPSHAHSRLLWGNGCEPKDLSSAAGVGLGRAAVLQVVLAVALAIRIVLAPEHREVGRDRQVRRTGCQETRA